MSTRLSRITGHVKDIYGKTGLSDSAARRRAVMKFARQYKFVYFGSDQSISIPVRAIHGVTSGLGKQDDNICIGTHDGYDIVFLERTVTINHDDYQVDTRRWHIMSFDLHTSQRLPFIFIGTKQQSHAFYAKLFTVRRETRQLDPVFLGAPDHFSAHYTLVASPAEQVLLTRLLTQPVTTAMARYQHPFAVELYEDTLVIITETAQTSQASLTKMMHYGLWLAKHIDQQL